MSTPQAAHRNALAESTSPYLLQHANNPVEWYPWGEQALERARHEDKPILLSIGYSACHWCHVMAHESFEDEPTAALMNENFVNIKVDREERPDLDRIYQVSHYLLTQRNGGWPLTVFLNPHNRTPFFAGTYFPRDSRYGMPGFRYVLERVAEFYRQQREEVDKQNAALIRALARVDFLPFDADARISSEPLNAARQILGKNYDTQHGGFGGAPKFPHPTSIERMLRHYAAAAAHNVPDDEALHMAIDTLRHMARGGIYDQIGGGFCRYSVDAQWMIPHFEKMLYDNGPLLGLYCDAWQLTGDPLFERILRETADWAIREMQAPGGGFYSILDADSEGEEGKFYVWSTDEVRALLDEREYPLAAAHFGLDGPPNFEGKWHLHVCKGLEGAASEAGVKADEARALIDSARAKLLAARATRVRPACDDKVLVSWNALMIKGLARAALATGEAGYRESAQRALDFIRNTLWRDGRLLATCKGERAHLNAYLDDHAFLIDAALSLLQSEWRTQDLLFVRELAEVLLSRFEDSASGGFFFTSHDHEQLIHRSKPMTDDSLPSGNGIAALALGRLGHLLGETRYLDAAERVLKASWAAITQAPYAHTALLAAVEEHLLPPEIIVLRGEGAELARWHQRCVQDYAPRRLAFAIPSDTADLPGLLAERSPRGGAVAYVCEGMQCRAPIEDYEELRIGARD